MYVRNRVGSPWQTDSRNPPAPPRRIDSERPGEQTAERIGSKPDRECHPGDRTPTPSRRQAKHEEGKRAEDEDQHAEECRTFALVSVG